MRTSLRRLLLAALTVAQGEAAFSATFVPDDDSVIVEQRRDRATTGAEMRELRALRARLAAAPHDLALAVRIAWQQVAIGRREGDPRLYGYAEATLSPWWAEPVPPPEVLMIRATVLQNRHQFDAALEDLSTLLRIQPRNPQGWLTRAVVLNVVGESSEAAKSCLPLRRLASPLLAATCSSYSNGMAGNARAAYRSLLALLARGPVKAPPAERQWALVVLADLAERLGLAQDAERHYRQALATGLRDVYTLGRYVDLLLDQNRNLEAYRLVEDDNTADPLLLRLAIAERRLAIPGSERHLASLESRYRASRRRGSARHLGSEARFTLELLGRPRDALALALRNWSWQREPKDARLVLAAAVAAGEPEAAAPVLQWLARSRLEDVRLDALRGRLQLARRADREGA